MSRKASQVGLSLIKSFEGCRLTAYKPVPTEKYWTIGWGHHGPDVKQGMTITQAQADDMLVRDLAKFEAYVNDQAYVPITDKLNQNQFDALVSFCYNCGPGNLKKLCAGRTIEQIAQNITAYNKAGGKVLTGLVRRREAELILFNKKEGKAVAQERDINTVSPWAASAWEVVTKKGYFDGERPGAPITREEMAVVIMRMESKK